MNRKQLVKQNPYRFGFARNFFDAPAGADEQFRMQTKKIALILKIDWKKFDEFMEAKLLQAVRMQFYLSSTVKCCQMLSNVVKLCKVPKTLKNFLEIAFGFC
jgi:hypothetical protein